MTSAEPAVRADGLVVRRGGRTILDDLTFAVAGGQVTGLLGPSGCGKTTLMRTLVGVQEVTAGQVTLVGTFSGGQLARAGLAVALLGGPDLLVLDEPTVGLDPVLRHDLWGMFHRLAAQGTALIVSSHVMDEAARCDHLLFMREGRFLSQASPARILRQTGASDLETAFLRLAGGPRTPVAPR